jgi:uroporphyrin-III C-methyltransferase/precorrin-2 dehydrogenase/sirohydrochlorin ferrochelatase
MEDPTLMPVFLKLTGRSVLLVGGGTVAASKLRMLLDARARVTVVAPDIRPDILAADVTLVRRPFKASDLDGHWLVVAAAPPDVNREVSAAAEARRIFVNAVDDPRNATAYLGGVLRRDGVTVAISTDGRAPALAGLLREALGEVLPEDLARWVTEADIQRRAWKADGTPMNERRPLLLDALNRLYARHSAPAPPPAGVGGRKQ